MIRPEHTDGSRFREPAFWVGSCRLILAVTPAAPYLNKLSPTHAYLSLHADEFQIEKFVNMFVAFVTYVHTYLHKNGKQRIPQSFSS